MRNHFESIGKPILSKGGEVMMVNEMLKWSSVSHQKHPQALPQIICHRAYHSKSVSPRFPHRLHRVKSPDKNPSEDPQIGTTNIPFRCHRNQWPTSWLAISLIRSHRVLQIGLTEKLGQLSVNPFLQIGPTEFEKSVSSRFGNCLGHPYRYHRVFHIGLTEKA